MRIPALLLLTVLSAAAGPAWASGQDIPVETLLARAEAGDLRAAFMLGSRFAARGGAEDEEAVRWFRRAAEGGLAEGQYNLGTMYSAGRGVARDDAEAARWLSLAARQGMAEAQFNLASFYASGRGVERDEAVAAAWFEQAAVQGLAQAQLNLGLMYEYGRGVPADHDKALAWYDKAASQGYATAGDRASALRERLGLGAGEVPAVAHRKPSPQQREAGNAWVAAQEADRYTLQLASFLQAADAKRFIERELGGRDARIYVAFKRGGRWHSVVLGQFASAQEAEKAAKALPAVVRKAKPWVRRFGAIHAELERR